MKKRPYCKAHKLGTIVILIFSALANIALAKEETQLKGNQDIRFYKVNKQMQGNRIMLTKKKSKRLGCHNFVKQVRVHRAVQIGFAACSLYQDKDCRATTIVPSSRAKDPRRTYLLTEGFGWLPQSEEERGVEVKSWQCDAEIELDLLVRDSQLAEEEVSRLRIKAVKARKFAKMAKQKADKATKVSKKAIESATAALDRAVNAGYEAPPVPVDIKQDVDATKDK